MQSTGNDLYTQLTPLFSSLFVLLMLGMAIRNWRRSRKERRHYRETGRRLQDDEENN